MAGRGRGSTGYLRSNIFPFHYLSWKVKGRKNRFRSFPRVIQRTSQAWWKYRENLQEIRYASPDYGATAALRSRFPRDKIIKSLRSESFILFYFIRSEKGLLFSPDQEIELELYVVRTKFKLKSAPTNPTTFLINRCRSNNVEVQFCGAVVRPIEVFHSRNDCERLQEI